MKEFKKILLVHNYYQYAGGEDTVVENEKNMLEKYGHSVILYTRHNTEIDHINIFNKLLLPFVSFFNIKTYLDIKRIIIDSKVDLVHVHNTLHLVSPAVYYAAVRCGVPVIQTVHNFRLLCPGATFYRDGYICEDCITKGLFCAIAHRCYRASLLQTIICSINTLVHRKTGILGKINFICLTEFTRKKILQLSEIKEKRVFVKPNFIQDNCSLQESVKDDYYLFLGRLEEIKGINLLIEAFRELPKIKVLVIGTGPLEDTLKQKIVDDSIDNVKMLGFVPHESVWEYLKKAKALIMCSQWYETFGMVIAEAYSCKTPVVVGKIGNIQDLVVEGRTGYTFKYNSKTALVNTINKMERSNYVAMGRNAYELFKEFYSEKYNYSQLMKIYNSIVATE